MSTAVLLTLYGTLDTEAEQKDILPLYEGLSAALGDVPVYLAYAGGKIAAQREDMAVSSAMKRALAQGADKLLALMCFVVRGVVYDSAERELRRWSGELSALEITPPLMYDDGSVREFAQMLSGTGRSAEAELLVVHGTGGTGAAYYGKLQAALCALGRGNMLITELENRSGGIEDTAKKLEGCKAVKVSPLMICAGHHAKKGIFKGENSICAALARRGIASLPHERGLGAEPEFIRFLTRRALNGLEKCRL